LQDKKITAYYPLDPWSVSYTAWYLS